MNLDFLKHRYLFIAVNMTILVISILFLVFWNYNLSIDMTGGINMEYSYEDNIDIETVKQSLANEAETFTNNWNKVINNISVYTITWEKAFSVVAWFDSQIDEKTLDALKLEFRWKTLEILKGMDDSILETKYVNIWKTFWDYIRNTAFLTLGLAAIAITIYISYAFSWVVWGINIFSFAAVTLFTLLNDVLIAAGIYVMIWYFLKDYQIDTFFITALLTILWYSINNTIVIFDRIRLNLREYAWKPWKKWKELYEITNMSVWSTITRSLYTSFTLILVLLSVFIFWPETLKGFILVMMIGTTIWTFTSVLIAPALLYEFNKKKKLLQYVKKVNRVEDKIVV